MFTKIMNTEAKQKVHWLKIDLLLLFPIVLTLLRGSTFISLVQTGTVDTKV